jgi:pimeloyl-ACP methyl ester carboxylesterase
VLEAAFTVRTYPAPDCFKRAAGLLNEEIYVGMQGASEFTIGGPQTMIQPPSLPSRGDELPADWLCDHPLAGVLASWSVTDQLHRVAAPTLLTHGRFDTMRPPVLRAMAAALRHAKVVLMPRSGHCSMIDDPKLMNDEVG